MNELDFPFGYCTNVHAGTHIAEAKSNLLRYAGDVRKKVAPGGKLPVGLWLADKAARELAEPGAIEQFRDWLGENRFLPFTFNGFPQGDFHQEVVKQKVYEPSWLADSRREHTILLADDSPPFVGGPTLLFAFDLSDPIFSGLECAVDELPLWTYATCDIGSSLQVYRVSDTARRVHYIEKGSLASEAYFPTFAPPYACSAN